MGILIIAEAGVNHNGSLTNAKKLIDCAVKAGADVVKFQTFIAESIISKTADKADYQKKATGSDETQFEMVRKLELSYDAFSELSRYCKEKGIVFLSTPFEPKSIDFLHMLGMPFWKVPSGEITNLPYLIKIAETGMDVVMSTGMADLGEIRQAMSILHENGAGEITLLHCNTEYPTPMADVNLLAMQTLKKEFGVTVGYSDHTLGIEVPIAAAALGASIIEKHFTLDKAMQGPDHKASLEPDELKTMVKAIRNIEAALGDGIKTPTDSEKKNIGIARKSIIAKCNIKKGEMLTQDNLTVKRPGTGISPMCWFDVIGRLAVRDFEEDELIEI